VSLGQHWNTSHLAVGVDPPEVALCSWAPSMLVTCQMTSFQQCLRIYT
jgi:hypothetical protein